MKILFGTHFYAPYIDGGAEISTQLLAEGLHRLGHAVDVVALGPMDTTECINGVKVTRWYVKHSSETTLHPLVQGMAAPGPLGRAKSKCAEIAHSKTFYRRFLSLLREGGHDAVVVSTSMSHFGRYNLWKAAHDQGRVVVQVFRDYQLARLRNGNRAVNCLYRAYTAHCARKLLSGAAGCSRATLRAMPDFWRGKPAAAIYNAVDIPFAKPRANRKKAVVYAGRIVAEKGIWTLIRAFETANVPGSELLIVGRGALLDGRTLPGNVRVIPWLEKKALYDLFASSSLVALPSEWAEPFGRTIIEAVACGTVAVGANIGGIPEVFDSMEKYLFPPGDARALSEKIRRYLDADPVQYAAEVCLLQAKFGRYTAEACARDYEQFLRGLVRQAADRAKEGLCVPTPKAPV